MTTNLPTSDGAPEHRVGWFAHDKWRIEHFIGSGRFGTYYQVNDSDSSSTMLPILLALTSDADSKTKSAIRAESRDWGILPDGYFFFVVQFQQAEKLISARTPDDWAKSIETYEGRILYSSISNYLLTAKIELTPHLIIQETDPLRLETSLQKDTAEVTGKYASHIDITYETGDIHNTSKPPLVVCNFGKLSDFTLGSVFSKIPAIEELLELRRNLDSFLTKNEGSQTVELLLKALLSKASLQGNAGNPKSPPASGELTPSKPSPSIEEAFAHLDLGWFAVDAPHEMTLGSPSRVNASAIRSQIGEVLLASQLTQGNHQMANVPLGQLVCMELVPDDPQDFSIRAMAIAEQPVLPNELTIWEWLVIPQRAGPEKILRVVAANLVDVSGGRIGKSHPVRTLTVRVVIRASGDFQGEPESLGQTRAEVRRSLMKKLRTNSELDAWCLDYFPEVYERFSSGMNRMEKCTLLLELVPLAEITAHLRGH